EGAAAGEVDFDFGHGAVFDPDFQRALGFLHDHFRKGVGDAGGPFDDEQVLGGGFGEVGGVGVAFFFEVRGFFEEGFRLGGGGGEVVEAEQDDEFRAEAAGIIGRFDEV